jgi:hypothetical protein
LLEVIAMTHPDIAQAVANARRDDMLRAADRRTGTVVPGPHRAWR